MHVTQESSNIMEENRRDTLIKSIIIELQESSFDMMSDTRTMTAINSASTINTVDNIIDENTQVIAVERSEIPVMTVEEPHSDASEAISMDCED